jgi:hypothetical protein
VRERWAARAGRATQPLFCGFDASGLGAGGALACVLGAGGTELGALARALPGPPPPVVQPMGGARLASDASSPSPLAPRKVLHAPHRGGHSHAALKVAYMEKLGGRRHVHVMSMASVVPDMSSLTVPLACANGRLSKAELAA